MEIAQLLNFLLQPFGWNTTKESKGNTISSKAMAKAKENITKESTTKDSIQKGPRANARNVSLVAKAVATATTTTNASH